MVFALEPPPAVAGCTGCDQRYEENEHQRQFNAAQRELGAFVVAVRELYGASAALDAANCWVEIMKAAHFPEIPHGRDWRAVTVQAASRLALTTEGTASECMPREGN